MEKEKYLNDLSEIRKIMSRSARFISLSGLSGVSTGVIALAGALLAYQLVFSHHDYLVYEAVPINTESLGTLLLVALGTLLLSVVSALWFTGRKSRKENQHVWDNQAKRLLINLLIPLTTGGILCLILLFKGYVGFIPALTFDFLRSGTGKRQPLYIQSYPISGNRGDSTGACGVPLYRTEPIPVDVGFWCGTDDLRYADSAERVSGERVFKRFGQGIRKQNPVGYYVGTDGE